MEILDLHEDHTLILWVTTASCAEPRAQSGSSDSQQLGEEFHLEKVLPKWHFLENVGGKGQILERFGQGNTKIKGTEGYLKYMRGFLFCFV